VDSSQRTGNRTIQNSAIAPDTTVMNDGSSQLFTITPAAGFYIVDVTVDGSSAGSHAAYGFVDVTAASNRTISGAGKRIAWTTWNPYNANSPLLESGLLGPVTIQEPAYGKP
jgi:hypothetical protein